jgi:gas vesicle protein
MNKTGKILTAFAVGAAAGALVGILLAPRKGSETRSKINAQGKKLAGDLKDKFRKGKEKINDLKEDIEKAVREKAEEYI